MEMIYVLCCIVMVIALVVGISLLQISGYWSRREEKIWRGLK